MLTNDEIQQNKIEYLELLSRLNIDLTNLIKFFDNSNFFFAPASIQNFNAFPGGLCKYMLDLYHAMEYLRNSCFIQVSDEDLIKVALFKGFYKSLCYITTTKNQKNPITNQWEEVLAYQISDNRPMYGSFGFSSYMLAKHFISFTDDQILAICYGRTNETNVTDIYPMLRQNPLLVLTNMADMSLNLPTKLSIELLNKNNGE